MAGHAGGAAYVEDVIKVRYTDKNGLNSGHLVPFKVRRKCSALIQGVIAGPRIYRC